MKPSEVVGNLEHIARSDRLTDRERRALMIAASVVRTQMIRPWDDDVRDFQVKFSHATATRPTLPDRDVIAARQRFIHEEFKELYAALESRDLAQIAHESVDLVYVVLGTMVSCGLSFAPFFNLIHEANMKKERNPIPNGKTIKPPGWVKPDCSSLIKGEVVDFDPAETKRLNRAS